MHFRSKNRSEKTRGIQPVSVVEWKQARVTGVRLRRFTGHVGGIEVGAIEFDGSNQLWTWSSPLAEDVWGHAPSEGAARQAFETWLPGWVERLRPLLEQPGEATQADH